MPRQPTSRTNFCDTAWPASVRVSHSVLCFEARQAKVATSRSSRMFPAGPARLSGIALTRPGVSTYLGGIRMPPSTRTISAFM